MNPAESGNTAQATQATEFTATLAGGCFWCLEAVFRRLRGVRLVSSGYCGGRTERPTYQQVCDGESGHAEAVRIHFDPDVISYRQLLEVFFAIHDPTTLDRQGHDIGTQYRSAIFTHDANQADIARATIAAIEAAQVHPVPLVTEIAPARTFYPAEPYHQEYFEKNPQQAYCRAIVAPKVEKFADRYGALLKQA